MSNPDTIVFDVQFDDHNSYYEFPIDRLGELLDLDPEELQERVVAEGKSALISSSNDVDIYLGMKEDVDATDLEELRNGFRELISLNQS